MTQIATHTRVPPRTRETQVREEDIRYAFEDEYDDEDDKKKDDEGGSSVICTLTPDTRHLQIPTNMQADKCLVEV